MQEPFDFFGLIFLFNQLFFDRCYLFVSFVFLLSYIFDSFLQIRYLFLSWGNRAIQALYLHLAFLGTTFIQ